MSDWVQKAKQFLSSPIGHVTVGLLSLVIGFVINALIQWNSNVGASSIIRELLLGANTPEETLQLPDKVEKIIETMFSPISIQSFVYTFLFAFFGFTVSNIFFPLDKKSETLTTNEDVIIGFLEHLTENCYNRCSNTRCIEGCLKLANESDGLLKRYLYEESRELITSMDHSKKGEYALDNNIKRFHTIAIDHLIAAKSRQYAVVQWIGSKPYSEDNKYQETYDMMDFHFLNVLLDKLTTTKKKGKQQKITNKLTQHISFKIKWLIIGDISNMKNNFDYIFYVIKSKSPKIIEVVKGLFEFYLISESDYRTAIEPIIATSGPFCKSLLNIENKPSFGVFGDNFMFADSPDPDHHGSIYTRSYNPDKESLDVITSVNQYFEELISNEKTSQKTFDELMDQYNQILRDDQAWEGHLKTVWYPEAH